METVLAAVISGLVTLAVCLVNNRTEAEKTRALIDYRLLQLEKKQDMHNGLMEKTYRLQGEMTEVQHEIQDLKKFHQP